MRSPIAFRDWLHIVGILFIFGAGFFILRQLPFVDSFLDKIGEFIASEYIY